MDPITQQIALACAGSAGAGDATYVDDVFSTFLYDGNGSTSHSINNGIDLSGEGGMVWFGRRDSGAYKPLFDTERGATKALYSNDPLGEDTASTDLTAFNSNGFTVAQGATVNANGGDYVSWTFRKAPGFFDVVTYTGNGTSGRSIAHSLGSVPGSIWVKNLTDTESWVCYHRGLAGTFKDAHERFIQLNNTGAAFPSDTNGSTASTVWGSTAPDADNFYVGNSVNENASGKNYVAYIFAHDDQSFGTNADESIIKCGSLTISSQATVEVNLGFESQFVLLKRSDGTANWFMFDTMRGMAMNSVEWLHSNLTSAAEAKTYQAVYPTPTGFGFNPANNGQLVDGTYIYMAIRRPHKPPEDGTDVFHANTTGNGTVFTTGFDVDWAMAKQRTTGGFTYVGTRLTGNRRWLRGHDSSSETDSLTAWEFDHSNGFVQEQFGSGITWTFARAPGFFDAVCFTSANTSTQTVSHNLGAVPEFFVVKKRDSTSSWQSYHASLGNTKYVKWDQDAEAVTSSARWNNTTPTATQFTLGSEFQDSNTYVALLFATLPGISKVGSYSGTGNNVNVDCGFSAGARFVLIKRSDTNLAGSTGDWYIYDSTRGIVSGDDPYLFLNETNAEVTSTDYIDPLNSGFTVTSSAPVGLNASGGTYIYLAIA